MTILGTLITVAIILFTIGVIFYKEEKREVRDLPNWDKFNKLQ
jgi:hypothetical protein